MKKITMILMLTAIIMQGMGMEISAESQKDELQEKQKPAEKTEITIGNDLIKVTENDTSVKVKVGNRGLNILESLEGGRRVEFEKYDHNLYTESDTLVFEEAEADSKTEEELEKNDDSYTREDHWSSYNDREERRENRRNRFRGHWSGMELGFNNYTTSRSSFALPDDISYMTLHSGKSMNFNLNFAQVSLGLMRHAGFVTGIGLNFNNYKFDGNNNILKTANGQIALLDPGAALKKSKLSTLYLTLPFLLELQLPVNSNHLIIAAGPIGAVKLESHSKMLFEDGQKIKSSSDFSLNLLRCGGTARVGFSNFQLYGTYYVTPLFQEGKGPGGYNLYPFEVGIAFSFNN